MPDSFHFIGVAQQQGYSAQAAQAALEAVRARLAEGGVAGERFYVYRTGDSGVGGGEGSSGETPSRARLLLAFQSADSALAFAQSVGLGASPRLIALSLSQALAALIQRPAIAALLIAAEDAEPAAANTLPHGLRLERATLIDLLAGVTP